MIKDSMCTDSASLKGLIPKKGTVPKSKERMLKYKTFSVAFSYPDNGFCTFFPMPLPQREILISEYDQLFRAGRVWLYGAEYVAENEFQRVQSLADINGFYRAFGLETDKDRPDALSCELEFMHYLIFKEMNATDKEKTLICQDAQKKFFTKYLYPAATRISAKVIACSQNKFYLEVARKFLRFLKAEAKVLFKRSL